MRFFIFRPNRTASSVVWVVWMILSFGSWPTSHAGNRKEANSDFVCLGGMLTIRRLSFLSLIALNFSATQEIDKIQQEEKAKLAAAETEITTLKIQLTKVLERLDALENA